MRSKSGAVWVVLILLVAGGVIGFGRHNADEYGKWFEGDGLAREYQAFSERRYDDAKSLYDSCVNREWGSAGATSNECYTAKARFDDARKYRDLAREQVRSEPPAPSLYFNGFFAHGY